MISLVWSMLRARRAQALVLVLLSVLATVAAVAGPVYLRAVDHATVATEVAHTPREELTVSVTETVGSIGDMHRADDFDQLTGSLQRLPGFDTVYSAEFGVLGIEEGDQQASRLTFREDVCPHLELVAGRCAYTAGEMLIGESTARRRDIVPGTTLTVVAARYNVELRRLVLDGPPSPLTVVGVYRPVDLTARYWGRAPVFPPGTPDSVREPIFVTRPGFDGVGHSADERDVSAVPGPDAFTVDGLPALVEAREELEESLGGSETSGGYVSVRDDLSDLLDRIDRSRALARQVVPVAAVPLVALCWFVIFLAVGFGTTARRHELGLIALRGTRWPTRWWLTGAESILAILAGAPIGLVAGVVAVEQITRVRFGQGAEGLPVGATALAVLVAVGGALVAGLLAQRRELSGPVVALLRRVPARQAGWRSLTVETTVVVLAVVAAFQLRGFDEELVGLSLLVPGLVALAVALVVARLLLPLAGRLGAAALRRGRLAPALGALQLARRPGGQRLFVLLTVASALLGFAAVAVDIAGTARSDRASAQTGAARVLTVAPVEAGTLRAAVRAVDPQGRYAMAVGLVRGEGANRPPVLLVDSPALERVANWRTDSGPIGAAAAARELRPPAGEPFVVRDDRVELTVRGPRQPPGAELRLIAVLRPLAGGEPVRVTFGPVAEGPGDYPADAPGCAAGCRVVALETNYVRSDGRSVEVVVSTLREVGSGRSTIDAAAFGTRWRLPEGESSAGGGEGLTLTVAGIGQSRGGPATPTDTPETLPALVAGHLPGSGTLPVLGQGLQAVAPIGTARTLLRLGVHGVLVDLEYAEWKATASARLPVAEVWLTPDAPGDVADRLRGQGLVVVGETTAEEQRDRLDRRAPALALWFHLLAGVLAVLLALCGVLVLAAVDRRRRGEDTQALRRQGVAGALVRRAAFWSLLPVVLAALVTGLLAAGLAWWLAGDFLPIFADRDFPMELPRWPDPVAVLGPWGVAVVTFVGVAVGLGRATRVRD